MANTSLQDLQKIINTNTSSLKKKSKTLGNIYNAYASGLVNNGSYQAIENARQNMQNTTNRQYDDSARNYYAQYRRNEANLPARLSALGITGGASETAQLGLMGDYSGNLYGNESARANALNTGNMQYDQMIAENSQSLANQLAETYLNLALQAREEALAKAASRGSRRSGRGYSRYYRGGNNTTTGVEPSGGKDTKAIANTGINAVKTASDTLLNAIKPKKRKKVSSGGGTSKARTYNTQMYK